MAVQTTTSRISYTGNSASYVFAYNFQILSQSHLQVYVSGVLKTLGTDYTVSGVGAATGGNVTFTSAPVAGEAIVINRNVPVNQLVTTVNNDTIFAGVFDQAIDKLTMIAQQLSTNSGRALVLTEADPTVGALALPISRANTYLRFDANGLPTAVDSQITTLYYGSLVADPTVRPDGSAMQAGDLYYNSATVLFKVYSGSSWVQAIPSAALSLTNFTETAASAKTTFTVTGGYTASAVFVYLNGALLEPSEYTASNGSTVVLASACAIGDEFRCVGYNTFAVANAYPATGGTVYGSVTATDSITDGKGDVRSVPQNAKTGAYTLLASDNGKHISITTGGVTVPSGVFNVGDTVTIYNNSASTQTLTQGASVTLRQVGSANTGNRTLALRGLATILCVASNEFVITGGGLA